MWFVIDRSTGNKVLATAVSGYYCPMLSARNTNAYDAKRAKRRGRTYICQPLMSAIASKLIVAPVADEKRRAVQPCAKSVLRLPSGDTPMFAVLHYVSPAVVPAVVAKSEGRLARSAQ
ncbi:hypothetical protein FRB93_005062 [Tulasnella sp. JGI-2019a]|nr:hypothetical protein FRB93_005062 [Tulasnella sp. JGI-2019a]